MKTYDGLHQILNFEFLLESMGSKDAQPMPSPYSDVIHSFFKHMRTISSHQHPAFPRDNGNLLFPEGRKKKKKFSCFLHAYFKSFLKLPLYLLQHLGAIVIKMGFYTHCFPLIFTNTSSNKRWEGKKLGQIRVNCTKVMNNSKNLTLFL